MTRARAPERAGAGGRPLGVAEAVRRIQRPVFTTREIASLRGASASGTTQALARLAREGAIVAVTRGLWCDPSDASFTPFALVPFLAGGHRAYVSLLSALHLYGVLSQIPQSIFAATTGHTRVVRTPFGEFSFHQMSPDFFAGFDWYGSAQQFLVATREKALVDCLYLASRKGSRFRYFPELDLGKPFRVSAAREWIARIRDPRIRAFAGKELKRITTR